MKIFKGVLVAFYALIVLGSVQNYSSQYNGQEVFSFAGIIDNFIVSAILPLIIYGIGLLIRKLFSKKLSPSSISALDTDSSSTTNSQELKKLVKTWQVILAFVSAAILAILFNLIQSDSSTNSSAPSVDSSQIYDESWIPSGFSGYPDNDNIAWRWGTKAETICTYNTSSCWSVMAITRDGCPSGLYAEIAILDGSEVQIDFTNDSTTRVLPNTKVKLTFDTFNEQASTARISEMTCR